MRIWLVLTSTDDSQTIEQALLWKRCLLPLPNPEQHCWWLWSCFLKWFPLLLPGVWQLRSIFLSTMLLSLFEFDISLFCIVLYSKRFAYSCMDLPNSYSVMCTVGSLVWEVSSPGCSAWTSVFQWLGDSQPERSVSTFWNSKKWILIRNIEITNLPLIKQGRMRFLKYRKQRNVNINGNWY